ncbi:Rieske 2Fe-2S domain-containing protein [Arthrobacter sp. ZGTC131]|uniref:Rieske (2Fe-2S) protein n=1 Tax=Arthrobacter sp. ZGTC131 TaxID=2058898 RepID=UPI001CA4DF3D|nr:Rieske 2Fe-2S domain-containing protein [Arthrobacter sp. ZGTC131]
MVCDASEITPGERRIVNVDGRSIGVFNVEGRFYALHNGCPHKGGALAEGPICGTTLPTDSRDFAYGRDGHIVRCAWHGWEFDITNGQALADRAFHARTYPITVEDGVVIIET